jgi:hypothetical protein
MLYRMNEDSSVEAETARFLEQVAALVNNKDIEGMVSMFDGWQMPEEWAKPIAEMTYEGREEEPEILRTVVSAVVNHDGPKDAAFFENLMSTLEGDMESEDEPDMPDNGVPRVKGRISDVAKQMAGKAEMSLSAVEEVAKPVEAATIYDDSLHMAHKEGDDGLIYKAICKTGTLALSPGPGQIDVEEPLELTPGLFGHLVESVEERAFPYVTVPKSHENSMLENTGFVRKLSIEESTDPNDVPGTKVLWAGIQFTEPDVKDKIVRGTIPDTSVGVKFNYRNKRTGKLYPAALEHVALTHQPWVDGLTPFGSEQLLSLNASESVDVDAYLGVFTNQPTARTAEPKPGDSRRASTSKRRKGDILSTRRSTGGISAPLHATKPEREMAKTETTTKPSVEKLLASQQARIEKTERENSKLRRQLDLAQESIDQSATALHESEVKAKVAKWQDDGVPPALCSFAHDVLLSAGPGNSETPALNLSITKGEETVEESLSLSALVEEFVSRVPKVGSGDIGKIVAEMDRLNMSQTDAKSGEDRGAEMYEQTKKRVEGR